jgi:FlaA1/EpsC-like NDP-sugar epimerase
MITKHRARLIGLFVLSDVLAILISYFYSYLFRFYSQIIPVVPERGIPTIGSYIAAFPLFLAAHLLIFYFQGFYKSRLKRTRFDDFLYISLNAILSILVVFAFFGYLNSYSQGKAPLFHVTFKPSHGFLAVYFLVVIFVISILRTQIYYFMKRRYRRGFNLQNVLIIGAGEMGRAIAQKLFQYKDLGFVVKGFLDDEKAAGDELDVDGEIGRASCRERV